MATGPRPKPPRHASPAPRQPVPVQEEDPPRRPWIQILAVFLIIAGLAGTAVWNLYRPGPLLAEKFWMAGLVPEVPALRRLSAKKLRHYATRDSAVALVVFLNAMTAESLPPDPAKETAEEKELRETAYLENLSAAREALKSLCLVSGQSFGVHFIDDNSTLIEWSHVNRDDWGTIMGKVNSWAIEHFGQAVLINSGILDFILDLVFSNTAVGQTARPDIGTGLSREAHRA